MSTEKGAVKRRLSSEGARIEADTANLDHDQQHKPQQQTQQQQRHDTRDSSAKQKPHDPQLPSEASPGEAPSETADKENVKQPAVGTRGLAATSVATAATLNPESLTGPSIAGTSIAEETTVADTASAESGDAPPRQVIAVSASKSPAAFFNLARKFLVTNEMCDLSALEGAIVSAVDAAHLLERSKLASIVRIHTSYVNVEPKRRKQAPLPHSDSDVILIQPSHPESDIAGSVPASATLTGTGTDATIVTASTPDQGGDSKPEAATTRSGKSPVSAEPAAAEVFPAPATRLEGKAQPTTVSTTRQGGSRSSSGGRELRRARIVVTVRRTESYKRWLEENPLQAIIASEVDEDALEAAMEVPTPPPPT